MSSATAQVAVLGMRGQLTPERPATVSGEHPQLVRLIAFAALGLYGVTRWSKLLGGGTHGRLVGLLALALLLAGARPILARQSRPLAGVFTAVVIVAVFPIAGLPLHWLIHFRIAVMANAIGNGITTLPQVLVPYIGANQWVRMVIVLGGAVLLFDAALLLAFAPRAMDDLRRAGAALPLVALVAVPSTLVHPRFPYLNGLLLFLLLAAFVLADRINSRQAASALGLCLITALLAMLIAPSLDRHRAWLNYETLTGSVGKSVEVFDWTQTYGPIHWPHEGHTVLEIAARQPEYWKAEDLDVFDGHGWSEGGIPGEQATPTPPAAALAAWSQTIQVTIRDMRTSDVIGAGMSAQPTHVFQPDPGYSPGTWTTGVTSQLRPGESYSVRVYAPQPSAKQLNAAGTDYAGLAAGYRTLLIPAPTMPGAAPLDQVAFPVFHSAAGVQDVIGLPMSLGASVVRSSVYGPAYRLATRLARSAATPYAFVQAVLRYLSHGYTYSADPPVRAYPLASFLFTDRRGYCQQFAGAMALLLRMGGVPARVAVGFTQGRQDPTTGDWLISDLEAHAWVEVWFPSYGWVRFDPTPRVDPALRNLTPLPATTSGLGSARQVQNNRGGLKAIGHSSAAGARSPHAHGGGGGWEAITAGAIVLLSGLVLIWLTTRPLRSAEELVEELERALARTGRPLAAEATLAGLERSWQTAPGAGEYIRVLRLARFGGGDGRPSAAQRRALRRHLAFRSGPLGWLRALWALPPRRPGTVTRSGAESGA